MPTVRIGPFLGAKLAGSPRLLPDGMATVSLNHRADQGDLRPWNAPLDVATAPAGTKTIHMLARDAKTDSINWFVWNSVVNAIRGFRAEDSTKRTYYTGAGTPKVTDNVLGMAGAPYPTTYRDLGVPKPLTAPVLTQTTAGTGDDEERFYAYAYVTDWDEVGMPQIAGPITCKPGAVIDITGMSLPPSGVGENRGINRIRVWRTVTGNTSSEFYFLRDITPATGTADDARTPGSDVMDSSLYAMPPSDLRDLRALWNGMAAGITGNSVRYSEINKLHAWPAKYETLCPDTPVALAVWEKNLLITTVGRPRLVSGSSPEAMDDVPVEFIAGNVARQGTVSFGHGACWPTENGLAYVGSLRKPSLLTDGLLTPEQWKAMNPETIIASQYRGWYIGFYLDGGTYKGFMIDPAAPERGVFFLSTGYSAVFYDPLGESLYVLGTDNAIKRWNGGAAKLTTTYRSKVFRLPHAGNLAFGKLVADEYPATLTVKAAGQADFVRTVTSDAQFTLKGNFLTESYQFEVSTGGIVLGGVFSDDPDEIKKT